ncbi:hypothetical protein SCLCIDRAFT_1220243 [Scleroderma citrinum Foug A]|uniref:Proteasome assembly chaperone 1 n=1 Tax=Scleroderma citrinum Foug A TaxID=1036808 RepID=A0A0C2ZVP0_9AGAM|nr:hypothetical protein SCLCIDRAFT_1220243 [Scleroderma citrinum Foug A]
MDLDPLADTVPPRYAFESDDEDEYNPQLPRPTQSPATDSIKFIGQFTSGSPLVFVSGDAGEAWARGVNLGIQQGGIYVDNEQVGILFLPPWTQATIVVSETLTHLPLSVMNRYTTAIVDHLQPTKVSILDVYFVQGYISPKVVPRENAPIRYLSLGDIAISDTEIEPFAAPNLVQSTTGSFLAGLFLRSLSSKSTRHATALFLLPSSKMPLSLPPTTMSSPSDDIYWDQKVIQKTHQLLFEVIGEGENVVSWVETSDRSARLSAANQRRRAGEIGEGGMYI